MTTTAASPPASDASTFHAVQRRLAAMLPDAATLAGGGTLELSGMFAQERPRLDAPELLEGSSLRSLRVPGDPVARFAAFLDGTQSSRVTQYVGGVPLVHGTVAAVIRERRERRLTTWRTALVQRRVYAPLALVPPHVRDALAESGAEVFDTTATRELDSVHPFALQEAALQAVQRDRSRLEKELAEAWCAEEREALRAERSEALYIDGGISESAQVATSDVVVGVVKTHRQLYVHGDDLPTILGLGVGERSSVTRVAPRSRTPVASWYLRLREAKGHDPLWGLVRVEIAEPRGAPSTSVGDRANDVSRWVLAEALPLALPDGRWDKMVYGIRDCEEFLRAIQ